MRRAARTLVSFHAHPDDEALLTGGTLARAAAEGHRVVLVVATSGESGLTSPRLSKDLGRRRQEELRRSAAALSCARVELLGYTDSGSDGQHGGETAFSTAPIDHAAARLAAILHEEQADVLTTYDPAGGYGHPDHVAVHRVGLRAAELARTPVVLEATIDRALLLRAVRWLSWARWVLPTVPWATDSDVFTAPNEITHRIDVREHLVAKRRAFAAHVSQARGADEVRTLALALRLPAPVFSKVFGHEWFVERGRLPVRDVMNDVFATVADTRPGLISQSQMRHGLRRQG